jgi:hypothetical protein
MRTISMKTQPVVRADRPTGGATVLLYHWWS